MVRYLTCVAMFFIGILSVFGSEKDLIFYAKNCGEITLINYDENLVLNVDGDYTEFIKIMGVVVDKKFELEDRIIVEGYTPKLNDFVIVDNKKINIQLSINNDGFIVGYPLIKNSFWIYV